MHTAVGQVSVHTVDLGQVSGTADRADIHLELLMSAIVAVGQRQIHTLLITQIHRPTDQCFYSMYIVGNRISDILDLTTVAQFPESSFQILFLDRSNILSYVAVETVAHIRTVGYPAHDTVHLAELLYLQTARLSAGVP